MKLHSSHMQQRHTDAQTVIMLYQPAYVYGTSSHFLNNFGFDGKRKKITFIFITAIVCTVYSQQQSTQPSSSSSSAIVANVHKSYIRLVHGNYFRVTTALCHLTFAVLCRHVLKVVVRKVVVGKTVVSLKKLLCCGLFLRWHLRATIDL